MSNLIKELASLPTVTLSDGQDYVQMYDVLETVRRWELAQPEIAENLYPYKCYITDQDGLQHEIIHTGDIRRVTGWEI